MSEPMTTSDIEDVLSSIRKLVSEDLRPAQARGPLRLAPDPGKLILTPALRVLDTGTPPAPRAEAVVSEITRAPDPVAADPVAAHDLPMDDLPEPAPEPFDDVHAVTFTSVRLEGVVASIGAAVDDVAPSQPWEPETGDAQVTELPWVRPSAPPAPEAEAAPEPTPRAERVADAGPAAVEEAGIAPPPRAAAVEQEAPQVWSVVDTEEPLELDEEALREIIRDVIREELQGQLGERITRNIRKLVRSEVQRAMTLREIE